VRAALRPADRVFLSFAFADPAPLSPRGLLTSYVSRYLKWLVVGSLHSLQPAAMCSGAS